MTDYLPSDQRFWGLEDVWANPDRAGVEIIPVPYDVTSCYGKGSDKGPAAICEASAQLEMFDCQLKFVPYEKWGGTVTAEPLDIFDNQGHIIDGSVLADRLESRVKEAQSRRQLVITLGGEHTSVVGAIRACSQRFKQLGKPLTVLQFDAHSDLREEYEGTIWSHACAMKRTLDFHDQIVQVGIRSQIETERELSDRLNIPVFYGEEIPREDTPDFIDWLEALIESLQENVYITFDCDCLDPSVLPATGTPEPGGLSWRQINHIFKEIAAQKNIVGMDFCELAPIEGLSYPQFTVAKIIHRVLGYIAMGRKDD